MSKKPSFLFVYGTLMKGFKNPTARHLHQTQEFIGEGFFPGLIFKVRFYPGAVYLPEAETKVYGHLFKITQNRDELFNRLDQYEGVGPQFPKPNEFIREIIPVNFDGKQQPAYSYLFNKPYNQYPLISSGNFS